MPKPSLEALQKQLIAYALAFPEATLDHPWGENVAKVKKKVFVFFGVPAKDQAGLSVKLPQSGGAVLMSPFAKPTGYGLGKSGWVSLTFGPKDDMPVPLIKEWIVESYRAVAPKKLADMVGSGGPEGAPSAVSRVARPSNTARTAARAPKATKKNTARKTAAPKRVGKKAAPKKRRASK